MVYKSGKLKGQLTTAELRKLVRGHNKLYTIKIPKGATQPQIIKLIEDKGYNVNHEKGKLVLGFKTLPKIIEMKDAPVPKKKTEAEKVEMKKKKEQKEKERKKKEKDMRRQQIQKGRDIQKKIDMVQKKKQEKKAQPKPPKQKKKEDPTQRQALNNAQSIIDMFEKHGGKIKDSDFKNTKELNESISLVNQVLKDPSGLSPGKINFLKKAVKLHGDKVYGAVKKAPKKPAPKKVSSLEDSKKENVEGWKKYFKMVNDNKKLLESDKRRKGNPFNDSYDFFKNNEDVSSGQSNMNNKSGKWITLLEKKIKDLKGKEEVKPTKKPPAPKKEEPLKTTDDKSLTSIKNISNVLENPKDKDKEVRDTALFNASIFLLNKDLPFADFRSLLVGLDEYDSNFKSFMFEFRTGQAPPKYRNKLSKLVRKFQSLQDGELKGIKNLKELQADWIKNALPKGKVKIKMKGETPSKN